MNNLKGTVELGVLEIFMYSSYSLVKDVVSILDGRKDTYGLKSNQIMYGISGACAEAAVHKKLGLYFSFPVNVFKSVADCIKINADIRWTSNDTIRIREGDADRWMIGVSGGMKEWTIHGAIWVPDIKALPRDREHFYYSLDKSRPPCWNIPFKYFREIGDKSYLLEKEFKKL